MVIVSKEICMNYTQRTMFFSMLFLSALLRLFLCLLLSHSDWLSHLFCYFAPESTGIILKDGNKRLSALATTEPPAELFKDNSVQPSLQQFSFSWLGSELERRMWTLFFLRAPRWFQCIWRLRTSWFLVQNPKHFVVATGMQTNSKKKLAA